MTILEALKLLRNFAASDWFWHFFILAVQFLNLATIYFLQQRTKVNEVRLEIMEEMSDVWRDRHNNLLHEFKVYKNVVDLHSTQIGWMQMSGVFPDDSKPAKPKPPRANRENLIADGDTEEDVVGLT